MILFLLSFLGILSVWSDILKGRGELHQRKKHVSKKFKKSIVWQNLQFLLEFQPQIQTDKITRNESKNRITMVHENTFPV